MLAPIYSRRVRGLLWGAAGVGIGACAAAALSKRDRYDLAGKVVVITGGSRGLGLALGYEFAARGARLAICARDQEELDRAGTMLRQRGATALAIPCDVSDQGQVREMVRRTMEHYGRIDVLVANAGQISVAPVENVTIEDFERAMAVMFWGVVYSALEVLPHMKRAGQGRIAAITSIGGKVSVPHLLPYSCAKFAAVGFCEGLRAEVAKDGIKVTTIAPGLMRTGSYLKAEFKGDHRRESEWFGIAATSPVTSMSAERAARQIVSAIQKGTSEKVLTTQASVMARINGAFPGFLPDLMGLVNRFLPQATNDSHTTLKREEMEGDSGKAWRAFTGLGRRAAERLNEVPHSS